MLAADAGLASEVVILTRVPRYWPSGQVCGAAPRERQRGTICSQRCPSALGQAGPIDPTGSCRLSNQRAHPPLLARTTSPKARPLQGLRAKPTAKDSP